MASPPVVIIVATSTRTRPRSWPGVNPRRRRARDGRSVNPTRSASIRTATLPAWATTPVPSPDTTNPVDHAVLFTYQVPSRLRTCVVANPSISLQDRHFGASQGVCHPLNHERPRLARRRVDVLHAMLALRHHLRSQTTPSRLTSTIGTPPMVPKKEDWRVTDFAPSLFLLRIAEN